MKIIGIVKLIYAGLFVLSSFGSIEDLDKTFWSFLIVALPIYYLFQTGIWDFKGEKYERKTLLIIGAFVTLLMMIAGAYFSYVIMHWIVWPIMLFTLPLIIISTLDAIKMINLER